MADVKIINLPVQQPAVTDAFPLTDGVTTYKSTLQGAVSAATNVIFNPASFVKAWVNFNAWPLVSGVPSAATIRSQYNVSTVSWTNAADDYYDINFTTPMNNINYAVLATIGAYTDSATDTIQKYDRGVYITYRSNTINGCRLRIMNSAGSDYKDQYIAVMVLGT